MEHAVVVNGEQGRLQWGYYLAATVHPWTITRTGEGAWALAGTLVSVDTFRMSQPSLVFVAPNGWRWPVVSLQIVDASLAAVLGPKEKTHVAIRETADRTPAY